jgi:two-component system response regulator RegX3
VNQRRLLVVEDEPAIAEAVAALLRREGYETSIERDGPAALEAIRRCPPDLIVLDVMLPGLDGLQVCQQARQRGPYIPILMLTARGEFIDKLVGLEVGADAYLGKPVEPRELIAQVRALLRLMQARGGRENSELRPPLDYGPLRLWEEQHRLEVNGTHCVLPRKQFELLRLFLQQPGKVFGRETLLRKIWGYEFVGGSRTVDVHVQRLRARIETNPAEPRLIQTVRGFGYRLALQGELAGNGSPT